jgi:glyoxylase I family protein
MRRRVWNQADCIPDTRLPKSYRLGANMKFVQKIYFMIPLILISASASAELLAKIPYVGGIGINPCRRKAKVIADWYLRFGIETKEFSDGGFYGQFGPDASPVFFGIHPKKTHFWNRCSVNVSIVYRVEDFDESLSALKRKGLTPDAPIEEDSLGRFAHFHDPDGNKVSIWGK